MKSIICMTVLCLAMSDLAIVCAGVAPAGKLDEAATQPDASWIVICNDTNAIWKLPIAADAPLAKSPIAGVFTQRRPRVMSYQFTVPNGTYKVRVHFLQAEKTDKNADPVQVAVANGVVITTDVVPWGPNAKDLSIPATVSSVCKEVEAVAKNGKLVILHMRGIYGLEVIGQAYTIRVRCGGAEPYVDANGHLWEADKSHVRPIPTTGEINVGKLDDKKGEWINITDTFYNTLGDELGLHPDETGWFVQCDNAGNTFFSFARIGLWRYDWKTGVCKRVDQGHFNVLALSRQIVGNPYGAGLYAVGWWGWPQNDATHYAVRSLDGITFEPIASFPEKQGTDLLSIDWAANPHLVFAKVHHTEGQTAISTDGGKTFKKLADDGAKYANLVAIGDGIILKSFRDGSIMRSADLGETWTNIAKVPFTKPETESLFSRIGKTLFINNTKGQELFTSVDGGQTWRKIADSPTLIQPIVRGDSDRHLFGFGSKAAYESLDGGNTWNAIITSVPGPNYYDKSWACDQASGIFYYTTDCGIKDGKFACFCYRR